MRNLLLLAAGVFLCSGLYAQNWPQYSDAEHEYWYYIQYESTGLVVQQNGGTEETCNPAGTVCRKGQRLTAEVKKEGNEAQVWKIEREESTGFVTITNKLDKDVTIRYFSYNDDAYSGFYGTIEHIGSNPAGELYFIELIEIPYQPAGEHWPAFIINREVPPGINHGYYMTPSKNGVADYSPEPGARLMRNKNTELNASRPSAESVEIAKTFRLNFVSYGLAIKTPDMAKTRVYPNPATDIVSVEIPDGAKSISVINSMGQTVMKTVPAQRIEKINVSSFNAGVYFMKIEKNASVEMVKFLVK